MIELPPLSERIWDMKYRLKDETGAPLDRTIADTWSRLAEAAAEAEPAEKRASASREFFGALENFKFLPAGRIVAGAGARRAVTLFNCFVMGEVKDDLAGIFEALKEGALTMQQGGGIGVDFSTLRPRGAPVKSIGADASGPLSFMDVWDAMCRTIMSAGARRGAMMACLRCDHPDIEAFVEAKREPGRLRMFNLSVLVTDAFMQAVKDGKSFDLVFAGRVYKTIEARALWNRIMEATYAYAEPGVIFIDRINAANNLAYCETIRATNPCVTRDAWVMTGEGPRQVADLIGRRFDAVVEGALYPTAPEGFFPTGTRKVFRLTTACGHSLRLTADHPLRRVSRLTRWQIAEEWTALSELRPGDHLRLCDHRALAGWGDPKTAKADENEGYLLGLLVGDGTIKSDEAVLSAWPGRAVANGGYERPGVAGVMARAGEAARALPHRADFKGWCAVPGRGEYRLSLAALTALCAKHGLSPRRKTVTPEIERRSSAFYAGFLRGFFDADGSVHGSQEKGVSIRLAQSDLESLRGVQRMLLRLGIGSTLYAERRPQGSALLPDGRGGRKRYETRPQHELVIAAENVRRYADRIGFCDLDKAARLRSALGNYRRALNRERFVAAISAIEPDGEEPVFDVHVPGCNAFDANGFLAHNCGEQPLPPYGACLLGSINLAALVREPFTANAHIDEKELAALVRTAVRFLDDVIGVSNYPLPAQRQEALAKRRIGLGVTGLADAFIFCRARYGAPDSLALVEKWLKALQRAAYLASAELAAEKGAFPLFDRDKYLAGAAVSALDPGVRAAIARNGVRNALLTSIAPTGTISLLAGNVSSGIEPVFAYRYARNVLLPGGAKREEIVEDYAHRLFREKFPGEALPGYFVNAQELAPADHVAVQAAAQKYVDSSISKTINVPREISFAAFKDVYRLAYESGCKGCTTFRPNEITGAVLETQKLAQLSARAAEGTVVHLTKPLDRPETLPGATYKIKWPDSDHALYITVNDVIEGGRRRPFEIFINSKNMEHFAWTVALTRMISAVFRRGGDVSFVVEELKAVFDPRGGQWMEGRYVPSLLAAIGEVVERHMIETGFLAPRETKTHPARKAARAVGDDLAQMRGRPCPRCGAASVFRLEGCDTCFDCGHSRCS